jgi:hypothetical protein
MRQRRNSLVGRTGQEHGQKFTADPIAKLRTLGGLRRSDQLADGLLADAQPVRDRLRSSGNWPPTATVARLAMTREGWMQSIIRAINIVFSPILTLFFASKFSDVTIAGKGAGDVIGGAAAAFLVLAVEIARGDHRVDFGTVKQQIVSKAPKP